MSSAQAKCSSVSHGPRCGGESALIEATPVFAQDAAEAEEEAAGHREPPRCPRPSPSASCSAGQGRLDPRSASRTASARRMFKERKSRAAEAAWPTPGRARQRGAEALSERLESTFQENETTLAELEETYTNRIGSLGELFGVVRQVATATARPGRRALWSRPPRSAATAGLLLDRSARARSCPGDPLDLERLWYELQREMTEQGKVVRFNAPVLTLDGGEEEREVIRRRRVRRHLERRVRALGARDPEASAELARQPPAKLPRHRGALRVDQRDAGYRAAGGRPLPAAPCSTLLVDTPERRGERVSRVVPSAT